MTLPASTMSVRSAMAISAGTALALAIALLLIGPTHTVLAPWDVIIHFDESYRIYLGQAPHRDFTNSVGAFCYYLTALGMHLFGPSAYAIVIANVIFLAIATVLAIFVAYRRLPVGEALLFTVLIAVMSSAMCMVGRPVEQPGYVEWYNRYAWTLSCILFLQAFFPPHQKAAARPRMEGVIAAVTLSMIVYTKATFGVVCAGGLIAGLFFNPAWRNRDFLLSLVAAGVASIALAWLLMRVDLLAYANDVIETGQAQAWWRRRYSIIMTIKSVPIFVAALAAMWLLVVALPLYRRQLSWPTALRTTIGAAIIGACGLLISFANTGEDGEIPLFIVLGWFLLNETRTGAASPTDRWRAWSVGGAIAALVIVLAGPIFVRDARSIAAGAASWEYRNLSMPEDQRFDAASLADYVIPHDTDWVTEYWRSAQVPGRVNEGLRMLRQTIAPDDTVLTLAFSNPFPYALGGPPPRGVPLWLDYGFSFTEDDFFHPKALFADVDHVMIPIIAETDDFGNGKLSLDRLLDVYGPFLADNYTETGRSSHWILLSRRNPKQVGRKASQR